MEEARLAREKKEAKQYPYQPNVFKSPSPKRNNFKFIHKKKMLSPQQVSEKLYLDSINMQNKRYRLEKMKEMQEVDACTFKPEINPFKPYKKAPTWSPTRRSRTLISEQ